MKDFLLFKRVDCVDEVIRPPPTPVYSIHDLKGLAILTQLRVGLSKLNLHKFRHNFRDTLNPLFPSNDGVEDMAHFLLHCHSYDIQERSSRQ